MLIQSLGPGGGNQPYNQNQGGFGGPGMASNFQQMPSGTPGYGRGNQAAGQWNQPNPGNYGNVGNGFGAYQG
jgi:nucleolysin TIA-1/TIAR